MIAAARLIWPDLGRYADQMHIGLGLAWDAQQQRSVKRAGVLVVEVEGEA